MMNVGKFIYKNIDRIVYTSGFIGTWVFIKYTQDSHKLNINKIKHKIDNINENVDNIKELTSDLKILTKNLIQYHEKVVKNPEEVILPSQSNEEIKLKIQQDIETLNI